MENRRIWYVNPKVYEVIQEAISQELQNLARQRKEAHRYMDNKFNKYQKYQKGVKWEAKT